MRIIVTIMSIFVIFVLISAYVEIGFCQENKTCDPSQESCVLTTTTNSIAATTTSTTTTNASKTTIGNKVVEKAESPYKDGKDKWTVFAECCWELRLMYYYECDLYLKRCCSDANITDYKPVCASTGPGYIYWWKPYRRIFYNECAATKYLCESLPPLTMPWKCMWRRDMTHSHCKGTKNVIRERKPPALDCSRYGLEPVGASNDIIPPKMNYYKHPQGKSSLKWMMPQPKITLSSCGEVAKPLKPEPVLLFPPTTETPVATPVRFQELQELKSRVRNEREHKLEHNKTTTPNPTTTVTLTTIAPTTATMATMYFPSQPFEPPLMEVRTPEKWYGMAMWAILLGIFTVLFIIACFIFSLWIGSKANTDERRSLTQT